MEQKVYIAGLQPKEQNALRLLLNNYLKIQMKMLLMNLSENPTDQEIDRKWRRLRTMIDMYESMTYNYPVRETIHLHKPKLMFFNATTMRYVAEAIKIYSPDPNENTLDDDSTKAVNEHVDKLDKLIKMSLKCEYTMEEIKRIKGGG